MKQNEYLEKAPVSRLLLKFAIPCVTSMLVGALYNIVDQVFIGNSSAGTAGIMATTLVFPATVLALSVALLIGDGAAALYSISMGAKDYKTGKESVASAILSMIVSSLALMVLGLIFRQPVLDFLGATGYSPECQAYALEYFTIIVIGFPFYIFTTGAASIIRASGAPTYSMVCTLAGAIINIIFDPILIFGFNLGVTGAAIATIAGQIVSALIALLYFVRPPRGKSAKDAESTYTSELVQLRPKNFHISKKVLLKLLKLGISSFVTQISIAIITIVANNVVGAIGGEHATDAGGALGIVFKVFAVVIAFSVGVAVGGQPIIGYNYGAKRMDRVLSTFKLVIIANLIIGFIAMAIFEFLPDAVINIFGVNATDVEFYQSYAKLSFQIYLGGIILCCIQKASCIFLQSIDRPYKAMFMSLLRDVIFLVPAVCVLGFSGGLYGMLWAGPVSDLGAGAITIAIILHESHKLKSISA